MKILSEMFWIILIAVTSSAAYDIDKCCPDGEMYYYVEGEPICKKIDNSTVIYNSTYYWLPENVNETIVENININFNTIPQCEYDYDWLGNISLTFNESFTFLNYREDTYENGSFCLERINDTESEIIARVCQCSGQICISKCCEKGNHLNESNKCVDSENATDWKLDTSEVVMEKYMTVYRFPECKILNKTSKYLDEYKINSNGSILPNAVIVIDPIEYCVDYMQKGDGSRVKTTIACLDRIEISTESKIYGALSFLAVFFLVITAIILCWIPELGGTPKWALVIQVFCLLVAHLCLGYTQVSPSLFGKTFCRVIAFVMQFSFVAAFFWLNVMCIDLSRTFSSVKALNYRRYTEMKNFKRYSLYAWSGSFLITFSTIFVEYSSILDNYSPLKPNFGAQRCWFTTTETVWIFFFGPIGILLLINLAMFFYTSFKIIKLKQETKALRYDDNRKRNNKKNEKRFSLYLKMFMLMGIPWLTEIISWTYENKENSIWRFIWYITDFINIMRAVFIFVIFCCKEKVWVEAKKVAPRLDRFEKFILTSLHRTRSSDSHIEESGTVSTSPGHSESITNDGFYAASEPSEDGHHMKVI